MDQHQVQSFIKQIKKQYPSCESVEQAAQRVKDELEAFFPFTQEHLDQLGEAKRIFSESLKPIETLHKNSIYNPHKDWYTGTGAGDKHWPALDDYIAYTKGWGEDTAGKIGTASYEVTSLLADPNQNRFRHRGLVVGYVQSGKTANMTAVIARAVDAGYNFVIILAGLTNKLRQQTQRRMVKDLIERHPTSWHQWTSVDDDGDFRMPPGRSFLMPENVLQLCVVKKNVSPLDAFLQTVERSPAAILNKLRVLIIDDECDQASVNASSNELDVTAINGRIREIVKTFPAVSYVGYTATPFANVLINPYPNDNSQIDDLYPKDFITALELPEGYFGTEKLFGKEPVDADDIKSDEEGLDMIREVPVEDASLLQPASRRETEDFQPEIPPSLEEALLYFIACLAARRVRGDESEHMTMLVHTSVRTIMHEKVESLISAWVALRKRDFRAGSREWFERLSSTWSKESGRLPGDITQASPVSFDELKTRIPEALAALEVVVENGFSDNRIDYESGPKTYIVVGGSVLARGLTLEGLMVSYFLRSTNQYDTLLQMGRWFGFRPNYEDLPRIWTTASLEDSFRSLARIEAEVREDISEYVSRGNITPMEFAVRVRRIPGMAITSAAKMRAAQVCDISFVGKHIQTIRFDHKDEAKVLGNWRAASELVSSCKSLNTADETTEELLFRRVPKNLIRKFLLNYEIQENHRDLSTKHLIGFIDSGDDELSEWNVGVYQAQSDRWSTEPLGNAGQVRLTNRSKLKALPEEAADIKALMSKKDVLFDCRNAIAGDGNWAALKRAREQEIGNVPLLLIYPIAHDSESQTKNSKFREQLDAVGDLIGFGIVFPGDSEGSGSYYHVVVDPPSADELESLDEEITSYLESGHVI